MLAGAPFLTSITSNSRFSSVPIFRSRYGSSFGTPVGVQQKLMRHTDVRTTMRYGDAFTSEMAEAHGKVVGLALNGAQTERKVSYVS